MVFALVSFGALFLLHLTILIDGGHHILPQAYATYPWILTTFLVTLVMVKWPRNYFLQYRNLFLVISAIWPFLDGLMFLNDMATYHNISWPIDTITLVCLLLASFFGMVTSLQCKQPKERETAFLYSLFIGISAIWEYFRFGNFGYASFFFAARMISKILIPPRRQAEDSQNP